MTSPTPEQLAIYVARVERLRAALELSVMELADAIARVEAAHRYDTPTLSSNFTSSNARRSMPVNLKRRSTRTPDGA
jgi:hypothetical protein